MNSRAGGTSGLRRLGLIAAAAVALYFMYCNFGRVHQDPPRDASDGNRASRITFGASRKLSRCQISHTKEPAMDEIAITAFALGMLAVKGLVTFAIVYAGARLATRHERRVLSH